MRFPCSFPFPRRAGLGPLTLLLAGAVCAQERTAAVPATPADRSRLEIIEDLSESLANDLLELSVATRGRDLGRIGAFLPTTRGGGPLPTGSP